MDKPDSKKCRQCSIKHNKLRCSLCKYKTEEWFADHINSVLIFGDNDNFVPVKQEEDDEKYEEKDTVLQDAPD